MGGSSSSSSLPSTKVFSADTIRIGSCHTLVSSIPPQECWKDMFNSEQFIPMDGVFIEIFENDTYMNIKDSSLNFSLAKMESALVGKFMGRCLDIAFVRNGL